MLNPYSMRMMWLKRHGIETNPYKYDPLYGGPRAPNRGPSDWNAVPKPGVVDENYTPYGPPRPLSPYRRYSPSDVSLNGSIVNGGYNGGWRRY